MANKKVKEKNRKIPKTYSIKKRVIEEFEDNLESKDLCASNVIEELIVKYNKEKDNE